MCCGVMLLPLIIYIYIYIHIHTGPVRGLFDQIGPRTLRGLVPAVTDLPFEDFCNLTRIKHC